MRNLIPMLMFVMSWPLIVCTPGRHAGNKTALPPGATVLNAHEKELEEKLEDCVKAKKYVDSVESLYRGISKGTSNQERSYTDTLKKAGNKLQKAKDQYIEAKKWWFFVEEDIREYRTNDPRRYRKLNTLKGDNGHVIYVYIERREYVRDTSAEQDTDGATRWAYSRSDKQFYVDVGLDTINDAFMVRLKTTATEVGKIIAHEQGHITDLLKRPSEYMRRLGEWNELNCQARENRSHTFVAPAIAAQSAFEARLKRKKHIYKRNEFDKQRWIQWLDSTLLVILPPPLSSATPASYKDWPKTFSGNQPHLRGTWHHAHCCAQ